MTHPLEKKRAKPDSEICKSSIFARCEAMQRAMGSVKDAPAELLDACNSAVALAALDIPALGITPLCQDRCRLPQGEFLAYSGGDQEENDDNLSKRIQSQDHCTDAAAA